MKIDTTTLMILLATAVLIALIGSEILRLAIRKAWIKAVDTDYMTTAGCLACRSECLSGRQAKDQDLIKIVRSLREEVVALRVVIIKHMIHSQAPPEAIEAVLDQRTAAGGTD